MRSLQLNIAEKIVAINDKTSRHSHDRTHCPLHVISTFVSENGIILSSAKDDQ